MSQSRFSFNICGKLLAPVAKSLILHKSGFVLCWYLFNGHEKNKCGNGIIFLLQWVLYNAMS